MTYETIALMPKMCYNGSVEMAHCYQTLRVRFASLIVVISVLLLLSLTRGSSAVAPALTSNALRKQTDWNSAKFKQMVFVVAQEKDADPEFLSALCQCESSWRQFSSDGSVLRGHIVPQDIGLFQINTTTWGRVAQQLGYDLNNPVDNTLMAVWILQNDSRGIRNWSASGACWQG